MQEAPDRSNEAPQLDHTWLRKEQPSLVITQESLHVTDAGPLPAKEVRVC